MKQEGHVRQLLFFREVRPKVIRLARLDLEPEDVAKEVATKWLQDGWEGAYLFHSKVRLREAQLYVAAGKGLGDLPGIITAFFREEDL